ncbi:type II toxin-antitoxin system HicB family antitoxin [Ruminococcus sp.]|uniref:type II toxin-antitoxin system HicB family antitoxin n=1 Tax=Ruminococcus sp. TaxID=41978 RepID=UPI0025CB95BB|nr:type II toxin-antitoxin system HicB family antitoxin [Ruminococcus sp.]
MAKYAYPAIFKAEKSGYSVSFPDISGCFTQGDTLEEAKDNAKDALCLMLYDMEEKGEAIPEASNFEKIKASERDIVSLINCDTLEYKEIFDK